MYTYSLPLSFLLYVSLSLLFSWIILGLCEVLNISVTFMLCHCVVALLCGCVKHVHVWYATCHMYLYVYLSLGSIVITSQLNYSISSSTSLPSSSVSSSSSSSSLPPSPPATTTYSHPHNGSASSDGSHNASRSVSDTQTDSESIIGVWEDIINSINFNFSMALGAVETEVGFISEIISFLIYLSFFWYLIIEIVTCDNMLTDWSLWPRLYVYTYIYMYLHYG